ncbi:MAG TPA: HD domain-containing phosphohydrolase [Tepidisphaeraceae bacterium]|jgi:putative two-component system response regulator
MNEQFQNKGLMQFLSGSALEPINPASAKIMIIDDEPLNIKVLRKYLQIAGYEHFVTTTDSVNAVSLVRAERPDLILLDVMMPQVSGLDILQTVRADPALMHLPVLVLTASTDAKTKSSALDLGATDFLAKPIDASDLVPRVKNSLLVKAHHDHLAKYSEQLEHEVSLRTAELEASRLRVVHCLARAAEYRDDDTGRHVIRVGRYAGILARDLGFGHVHASTLELAAQLHDVGKIGIPDAVLLKPGKLSPEEFELMKKHCEYGRLIIDPLPEHHEEARRVQEHLGAGPIEYGSPLLKMAAEIALTHHERWDGTGYPNKIAGEQIPLEGRVTSVVDVFDALLSKRPYKPPFELDKCLSILREGRGKQFDPQVIDALLRRLPDMLQVQGQLADAA